MTSLRVLAANITVVSTNDSGPGSLRQAIADAASGDVINLATPVLSTITLNSPLVIDSGTPKSLAILGLGNGQAISGGNTVPVLVVQPLGGLGGAITLTIVGLTIKDGVGLIGAGFFNGG